MTSDSGSLKRHAVCCSEAVCHGCLSANRELSSLDNMDLYIHLLQYNANKSVSISTTNTKICWECHKTIRNVKNFIIKIINAQLILTNISQIEELKYNLSSLTRVLKKDYDAYFVYENNDIMEEDYNAKNENNDYWIDDMKASNTHSSDNDDTEDRESFKYEVMLDTAKVEVDSYNINTIVQKLSLNTEISLQKINYNDDNNESLGFEVDINNEEKERSPTKAHLKVKGNKKQKNTHNDLKKMNNDQSELQHDNKKDSVVKKKRIKKSRRDKFRLVQDEFSSTFDYTQYCTSVAIDIEESKKLLAKARVNWKFSNSKYKCETCVLSFSELDHCERHMKKNHDKTLDQYICDVCDSRFPNQIQLEEHNRSHMFKLVCKFCYAEIPGQYGCMAHFEKYHMKIYECTSCLMTFVNLNYLFDHYKDLHDCFICDYCNQSRHSKKSLSTHIRNEHMRFSCKKCPRSYKSKYGLKQHMVMYHVKEISENTYCVECNLQLDNVLKFEKHLKYSPLHRTSYKEHPCPDCGLVFKFKFKLKRHYDFVHLKRTDFHCVPCDKYYIRKHCLLDHIKYFHEKVPKLKNNICNYCGRGFHTRRVLKHHEVTHTGERPYACSYCENAYTQKHLLVSHIKKIHSCELMSIEK